MDDRTSYCIDATINNTQFKCIIFTNHPDFGVIITAGIANWGVKRDVLCVVVCVLGCGAYSVLVW